MSSTIRQLKIENDNLHEKKYLDLMKRVQLLELQIKK